MKRKKGQALVEFVIILPIFIFLLLGIIDIGKIVMTKNRLEGEMNLIMEEYQNEKSLNSLQIVLRKNNKNANLDIQEEPEFMQFKLTQEIDIITPGLNLIFKSPYNILVERSVPNES